MNLGLNSGVARKKTRPKKSLDLAPWQAAHDQAVKDAKPKGTQLENAEKHAKNEDRNHSDVLFKLPAEHSVEWQQAITRGGHTVDGKFCTTCFPKPAFITEKRLEESAFRVGARVAALGSNPQGATGTVTWVSRDLSHVKVRMDNKKHQKRSIMHSVKFQPVQLARTIDSTMRGRASRPSIEWISLDEERKANLRNSLKPSQQKNTERAQVDRCSGHQNFMLPKDDTFEWLKLLARGGKHSVAGTSAKGGPLICTTCVPPPTVENLTLRVGERVEFLGECSKVGLMPGSKPHGTVRWVSKDRTHCKVEMDDPLLTKTVRLHREKGASVGDDNPFYRGVFKLSRTELMSTAKFQSLTQVMDNQELLRNKQRDIRDWKRAGAPGGPSRIGGQGGGAGAGGGSFRPFEVTGTLADTDHITHYLYAKDYQEQEGAYKDEVLSEEEKELGQAYGAHQEEQEAWIKAEMERQRSVSDCEDDWDGREVETEPVLEEILQSDNTALASRDTEGIEFVEMPAPSKKRVHFSDGWEPSPRSPPSSPDARLLHVVLPTPESHSHQRSSSPLPERLFSPPVEPSSPHLPNPPIIWNRASEQGSFTNPLYYSEGEPAVEPDLSRQFTYDSFYAVGGRYPTAGKVKKNPRSRSILQTSMSPRAREQARDAQSRRDRAAKLAESRIRKEEPDVKTTTVDKDGFMRHFYVIPPYASGHVEYIEPLSPRARESQEREEAASRGSAKRVNNVQPRPQTTLQDEEGNARHLYSIPPYATDHVALLAEGDGENDDEVI